MTWKPGPVSWDEAFADRYEEWSAEMTADIAFYVASPARRMGRWSSSRSATGGWRSRSRRRPASRSSASTPPRRCSARPGPGQLRRASSSTCASANARPGPERARRADLLPVPRTAAPADLGRPPPHLRTGRRLAPARTGGSPGTPLPSTTTSPRAWTASTSRNRCRTRTGTRWATTGSTSPSTAARTSSLWWATKNEWLGLLDVAGLEVEALYGGFAGEPFSDDSREYVFVARRP